MSRPIVKYILCCLIRLRSYTMCGQSLKAEPFPEVDPASTKSKGAPFWKGWLSDAVDWSLVRFFQSHPVVQEHEDPAVWNIQAVLPFWLWARQQFPASLQQPAGTGPGLGAVCACLLSWLNTFICGGGATNKNTSETFYCYALFCNFVFSISICLREKLMDWKDFLLVKSRRNITMVSYPIPPGHAFNVSEVHACLNTHYQGQGPWPFLTYLEDFPGLIHFICVDRSTGQMIAPSLSVTERTTSELGKGPVAQFIKNKVWHPSPHPTANVCVAELPARACSLGSICFILFSI